MDVIGRTSEDPAARRLLANLVGYVAGYEGTPSRDVVYAGEDAGMRHLTSAGYEASAYSAEESAGGRVLVLGPGAARALPAADAVERWIADGGSTLAAGLDAAELARLMPTTVETRRAEYVAAGLGAGRAGSPFAGIGPGETHIREPREIDLLVGETVLADGLLAAYGGDVLACQVAPWQFAYADCFNLKLPFRRTSHLLSRLLGNLDARAATPLLAHFADPVAEDEARWLAGLYLDAPEEMDDPYRFFRW
jgi:hypothetical protein